MRWCSDYSITGINITLSDGSVSPNTFGLADYCNKEQDFDNYGVDVDIGIIELSSYRR